MWAQLDGLSIIAGVVALGMLVLGLMLYSCLRAAGRANRAAEQDALQWEIDQAERREADKYGWVEEWEEGQ